MSPLCLLPCVIFLMTCDESAPVGAPSEIRRSGLMVGVRFLAERVRAIFGGKSPVRFEALVQ